jgi:hypothetical protein
MPDISRGKVLKVSSWNLKWNWPLLKSIMHNQEEQGSQQHDTDLENPVPIKILNKDTPQKR